MVTANESMTAHWLRILNEKIVASTRCPRLVPFLGREMEGLRSAKVIVALGRIGFDAYLNYLKRRGELERRKPYVFQHGAKYEMKNGKVLLASYHPSNQNTQTGKLTRQMFMQIFKEAAQLADK